MTFKSLLCGALQYAIPVANHDGALSACVVMQSQAADGRTSATASRGPPVWTAGKLSEVAGRC